MICLIGESCSGKSSIEKRLNLKRIISYTTRPMRIGEKQDVDYHFITEEEYDKKLKNNFFAENTTYNSWHYSVAKKDCKNNSVCTVEPFGFRQLKKNKDLKITSFYIKVPERERTTRMMLRGDSVMESFRRIISDQGSFNGIEDEVDYVIENKHGKLKETIEEIQNIIDKL
jgi:guanylate kinase